MIDSQLPPSDRIEAWQSLHLPSIFRLKVGLCGRRTAFLLCIGFNIILQTAAQALGEERIEMMVNALLEGSLFSIATAINVS